MHVCISRSLRIALCNRSRQRRVPEVQALRCRDRNRRINRKDTYLDRYVDDTYGGRTQVDVKWLFAKSLETKSKTEQTNYFTVFKMKAEHKFKDLNDEIKKQRDDYEQIKKRFQSEFRSNLENLVPSNWAIDESSINKYTLYAVC